MYLDKQKDDKQIKNCFVLLKLKLHSKTDINIVNRHQTDINTMCKLIIRK